MPLNLPVYRHEDTTMGVWFKILKTPGEVASWSEDVETMAKLVQQDAVVAERAAWVAATKTQRREQFGALFGDSWGNAEPPPGAPAAHVVPGLPETNEQVCCRMYVGHPTTILGQSWGTMGKKMQRKWKALRCDDAALVLIEARANGNKCGE